MSGAAKEHLDRDQARWIAARNCVCTYEPVKIVVCVRDFYQRRIARLKELADGPYPFIGEHWLATHGKVGNVFYRIEAGWPQFDGNTADFSEINRDFADRTRRAADEVVPDAKAGREVGQQEWTYYQVFDLHRPSDVALAVSMQTWTRIGSSSSYGGFEGFLVDLRTGKAVGPDQVFAAGDGCLEALSALALAGVERQFKQRGSSAKMIERAKLAELLLDPARYHYHRDRLVMIFEPNVAMPDEWGRFTVEIPYATLKPLFRADGPLGR